MEMEGEANTEKQLKCGTALGELSRRKNKGYQDSKRLKLNGVLHEEK